MWSYGKEVKVFDEYGLIIRTDPAWLRDWLIILSSIGITFLVIQPLLILRLIYKFYQSKKHG